MPPALGAGQKAENPLTLSIYYCRSFGRPEFKPGAGSFAPTRPFKVLTAAPRQAFKGARTKWCKMSNPKKIDLPAFVQDDAPTILPCESCGKKTPNTYAENGITRQLCVKCYAAEGFNAQKIKPVLCKNCGAK